MNGRKVKRPMNSILTGDVFTLDLQEWSRLPTHDRRRS